jgi:hypothetical protein
MAEAKTPSAAEPSHVVLEMSDACHDPGDQLACPDDADADGSRPSHTDYDVKVDANQGN